MVRWKCYITALRAQPNVFFSPHNTDEGSDCTLLQGQTFGRLSVGHNMQFHSITCTVKKATCRPRKTWDKTFRVMCLLISTLYVCVIKWVEENWVIYFICSDEMASYMYTWVIENLWVNFEIDVCFFYYISLGHLIIEFHNKEISYANILY